MRKAIYKCPACLGPVAAQETVTGGIYLVGHEEAKARFYCKLWAGLTYSTPHEIENFLIPHDKTKRSYVKWTSFLDELNGT